MPQVSFELECDRLSHVVDGVQFERVRWGRTEGPMLARLVQLAHEAVEGRPDFELVEEGSTSALKRFVIKVHSNRVAGIGLCIQDGKAVATLHAIERSPYRLTEGPPLAGEFPVVDEQWMAAVFTELFSRVQA
jgi:hypothetical protein